MFVAVAFTLPFYGTFLGSVSPASTTCDWIVSNSRSVASRSQDFDGVLETRDSIFSYGARACARFGMTGSGHYVANTVRWSWRKLASFLLPADESIFTLARNFGDQYAMPLSAAGSVLFMFGFTLPLRLGLAVIFLTSLVFHVPTTVDRLQIGFWLCTVGAGLDIAIQKIWARLFAFPGRGRVAAHEDWRIR